MKDVKQLTVIIKGYTLQKDKAMQELGNTNTLLSKRKSLLKQISQYQRQYGEMAQTGQQEQVPFLNRNLAAFVAHLTEIIIREQEEITKIERTKITLLKHLAHIDQRIDVVRELIEKINLEKAKHRERQLQANLDDMALIKKFRDTYE